ncbi:MAG: M23 family metallopeptidase [Actinomycetota bacterium]
MRKTLPALAALAALLALGAAQGSADRSAGATARAWAVRIVVPGQADVTTRVSAAPPDAVFFDNPFSYPADGSIVTAAGVTSSVSAASGEQARAGATAQVTQLSIFKGEITAATVTGETHAIASSASASGDTGVTAVTQLVVEGQPVTPTPNQQIQLGDWGYLIALEQKGQRVDTPTPGYHDFVTAIAVFLTADHGGLPAQSEIQIGYAEADAQASQAAPPPTAPSLPTTTAPRRSGPPKSKPLTIHPKPWVDGYVFPIYGESSYSDTYGGLRGDVSGDWHHGDDIFANLGTPILSVAHGVVFSVGWNKVGGWRLWLRDDQGNEYYYAHLSAYSPYAVDGAIVDAGDVLGFVGNTGDAEGTPYHLHFEVHPVGLLGLGYDGAVDPTPFLDRWKHLQDVQFGAMLGWTPNTNAAAPKAGAILLQSSDISNGSGLDPASLARAMAPASGDGGLQTQPTGK